MKKIVMAIHGGAGDLTPYLLKHKADMVEGLATAVKKGYTVLKKGGSALDAVEEAVILLEDNPLYNAGRGSSLNCKGDVEMDASIMDGNRLAAGAVSIIKNIKNPVSLARAVMNKTRHVFLSGHGAIVLAKSQKLKFEPDAYFITSHQYDEFIKAKQQDAPEDIFDKKITGTVGAVALDNKGHLAAATSTGGTTNCLPGRIGDSCIIGSGCYADDNCALSGTGEGEFLITGVIAHTIAMVVELKKMSLQEACDYVIHNRNKKHRDCMGIIAVNRWGELGMAFNTANMKRAFIDSEGHITVDI